MEPLGQGTAAIAVAGVYGSLAVQGKPQSAIAEQRFVVVGAGESPSVGWSLAPPPRICLTAPLSLVGGQFHGIGPCRQRWNGSCEDAGTVHGQAGVLAHWNPSNTVCMLYVVAPSWDYSCSTPCQIGTVAIILSHALDCVCAAIKGEDR